MGKERPIIFTAESVKAILDGRKTMTRRVIKPQPEIRNGNWVWNGILWIWDIDGVWEKFLSNCPHGQVGDRGFTYFKDSAPTSDGYYEVIWEEGDKSQLVYLKRHNLPDLPTDIPTEHEWERWLWGKDEHDDPEAISLDIRRPALIQWRRVGDRLWVRETCYKDTLGDWRYRADEALLSMTANYTKREVIPSIFMPRWASRLTLDITGVRVERLQEITQTDVDREGISPINITNAIPKFRELWDSINGKKYPWLSNPWCWVIGFRRLN